MKKLSLTIMLVLSSTQAGSVTLAKDLTAKLHEKLITIENETDSLVTAIRSSDECKFTPKNLDEKIRRQLKTNGHSSLYQNERFRLDYCKFKVNQQRIKQDIKKEHAISEAMYSLPLGPERTELRNLSLAHYSEVSLARSKEESQDICNSFSYLFTAEFKEKSTKPITPISTRFDGAYFHCQFKIDTSVNNVNHKVEIQVKYDQFQNMATLTSGNTEIDMGSATQTFVTRVLDRGFINQTHMLKTYSH